MESLFDKTSNQKLIDRINQITAQSTPSWGKMNAAQMLAHCQVPFKVAFGELKSKRGLMAILFGKMAKKQFITGNKPFKKNLPTDKNFYISEEKHLEDERKKLIQNIQRFEQLGTNGLTRDPHPFFGKLTPNEWDRLMWKHINHHLMQFGL